MLSINEVITMGKRRNFSSSFKKDVVRKSDFVPISELCREHDIQASLIYSWRCEYASNPKEAFKGKGNLYKSDAKIARYERIIARQCAEIDVLKEYNEKLSELVDEKKNMRSR